MLEQLVAAAVLFRKGPRHLAVLSMFVDARFIPILCLRRFAPRVRHQCMNVSFHHLWLAFSDQSCLVLRKV